jgi:gliding motility-associated lipoprotein GldD
MKKSLVVLTLLSGIISSCGSDELPIPKPPTYLNVNLPEHTYTSYRSECPYVFDIPTIFKVNRVDYGNEQTCHRDIDLGPLNGTMHFSYIQMVKPLSEYINFSINKVDDHKIKATAIEDETILRPKDRVFGTFFELQGDVASPFQFYLTDSTSRFVSGVIYFNTRPNYDSIKPSLDYLKVDLKRFLQTFKWK